MAVKPQTPIINWGNPLTKGLILNTSFLPNLNGVIQDLATNHSIAIQGSSGTSSVIGNTGPEMNFTGVDNPIRVASKSDLNLATNFSIFVLVKVGSLATKQTLYSKAWGDDDTATYTGAPLFTILTTGKLEFTLRKIVDIDDNGTTTVSVGSSYLLGVIHDSANNYKFYINNVLNSTQSNVNNPASNSVDVAIGDDGRPANAFNQPFTGNMSFLGVWNRILTPTEVKQLFTNPFQIYVKPKRSLANILGTLWTQTLSETLTDTDTLTKLPSRSLSETITDTASMIRTASRTLSETITDTDTFTKLRTAFSTLTEAITHIDSLLKLPGKNLTETITDTDTFSRVWTITRIYTEAITHTDTTIRTAMKVLTDSISHVDSFVRTISRSLTETITDSDVFVGTRILLRTFTDTLTHTDTFSNIKVFLKNLTEAISLSDNIWRKLVRALHTFTKHTSDSASFTKHSSTTPTLTKHGSNTTTFTKKRTN